MALPGSTTNQPDRRLVYHEVVRAALLGLAANILLAVVKLVAGISGRSFALIADAVNSLGDVVTTVIVLVAFRVARTPPDDEHPYGHSRAEGIAASNVALLIIVSALAVAWNAVTWRPAEIVLPPVWTLWVAASNLVIKEALYHYKMRVGRRTGSAAMIANAWDHRSDAMCAFAVLVGLLALRWGGPQYFWADRVSSLVVAGLIVISGARLFWQSASELMDIQAEPEFVQQIRHAALQVEGVRDVESLWVRKAGLEFFADIHVQVDSHISVASGHRIGHAVKDQLLLQFPTLRDVLVHLEPHPHQHDVRFGALSSRAAEPQAAPADN